MAESRVDIGEVRMSFTGVERNADRAERISRLTFDQLHVMMNGRLKSMERDSHLDHLSVGPIRLSFDQLTDEAIAQESATEIYRALLGSF